MFRHKKKGKKVQENKLADGMYLRTDLIEHRESRCYTLLLKGVLVYLIVMGGMGCYLSSLSVECSWIALHVILLIVSLFCSMLYYNKRWEDFGYLLLLIIMAMSGNALRHYINSGFYAVANDLAEEASAFFDSNAMRTYGEQVGNRYLAITVAMCYVGSVCCILMNILISRRMQYIVAIPLCIGCLMMPLYFDLEPSLLYVAMLFAGLLSAYIIRGNGHYRLSADNNCYQFKAKHNKITYVYAGKALAGVMAVVFLVCFVLIQLMGIIYPQGVYGEVRQTSSIKEASKDTVENISMLGLMGLFNFYPNTGGLTNGTLGGVSAVRLDFEPDLVLEFAPYTSHRTYFKTFTGNEYLPGNNRWSRQTDENGRSLGEQVDETTKAMRKRYEEGEEQTGQGRIRITNKAAATGVYIPYYSEDVTQVIFPGETKEYTFYPELSGRPIHLSKKSLQLAGKDWLAVPPENQEVIAGFCREAGLSADASVQESVQALAQYFQENIPYTIRPGATPYRKDFVNYFLTENKRGYCAHFASAATLIFRYLGIPARYIEGYAIDPEDISEEGEIEYGKQYEDYYEGYSELGQTAVVSVNATDANAHAWVEVYDEQLGWQVADVTPASDEELTDNGLWQRILNFLRGSGNSGEADVDGAGDEDGQQVLEAGDRMGRTAGYLAGGILALVLLLVAGRRGIRVMVDAYTYHRAGLNDRLIQRYQGFLRKIAGRESQLMQQENYRDQLGWLSEHGYWRTDGLKLGDAVLLLEQAGFSNRQLTQQEFEQVLSCFCKK